MLFINMNYAVEVDLYCKSWALGNQLSVHMNDFKQQLKEFVIDLYKKSKKSNSKIRLEKLKINPIELQMFILKKTFADKYHEIFHDKYVVGLALRPFDITILNLNATMSSRLSLLTNESILKKQGANFIMNVSNSFSIEIENEIKSYLPEETASQMEIETQKESKMEIEEEPPAKKARKKKKEQANEDEAMLAPMEDESEEQLKIFKERENEITESWINFFLEKEKRCKKLVEDILNDPEVQERLKNRKEISEALSITYFPKKANGLIAKGPKEKKHEPKKGKVKRTEPSKTKFYWPLNSGEKSKGLFNSAVLPGGMRISQLGTLYYVPIMEYGNKNYVFQRNAIFDSRETRIDYAKKYYADIQEKNPELAAKALVILFSHVFDQYYYYRTQQKCKSDPYLVYINEELNRIGLPRMSTKTRAEMKNLFRYHTREAQESYYKEKNIKEEVQYVTKPYPGKEIPAAENNGVRIVWVKKKNDLSSREKSNVLINEIKGEIYNEDIDVYDQDTGRLIFALRKDALLKEAASRDAIEKINKYAFMTTKDDLRKHGVLHREGDAPLPENSKPQPLHGVFGFVGATPKSPLKLTGLLTHHKYGAEIYDALSTISAEAEKIYQAVAPEEFKLVADQLKRISASVFRGAKTTCAVAMNFDNQTGMHYDDNLFQHKTLSFLAAFFGSANRRFDNSQTYFPEYEIGVDLPQGGVMFADFINNLHCNAPIEILDGNPDNWHRISIVGFSHGDALTKTQRPVFNNSESDGDINLEKDKGKQQEDTSEILQNYLNEAKKVELTFMGKHKQHLAEADEAYEKRNAFSFKNR